MRLPFASVAAPDAPPTAEPQPIRPARALGGAPWRRRRAGLSWADVVLCLVGCAVVLLWLQTVIGVYEPDDAYITFRYAENLAAGNGLVFNAAAPPVEGYSNLSWILLLAGLARLGLDLPTWAANLGRLLSLLNLVLLYALSYRVVRQRGWALVAPALLALTAPYALWSRGGLETMWYTTLLLLSLWLLWLALSRRLWAFPLAALSLFLLALTRHDGAIPLGLGGLAVLVWVLRGGAARGAPNPPAALPGTGRAVSDQPAISAESAAATPPGPAGGSADGTEEGNSPSQHGKGGRGVRSVAAPPAPYARGIRAAVAARGAWVALGSFAGLALVYLAYTWWRGQYFGQLVPTPFFSRLGGTITDPAQWTHTLASYFTLGSHYSGFGDLLVPAIGGALAGVFIFRRPDLRDALVLACAAGLSLLYFISESYNPGIRYMVPVLPLFYVYAQLPLIALLRQARRMGGRGLRGWAAAWAVGLGVAVFLLVMAPRTADDGQRAEIAKEVSLVKLGQWLHNYAPPGASVALQDIGTVAYYSGLRVIDNNPGALTNGDLIYRAGQQGYADLTLNPRPEFLVFTSFSYVNPVFAPEFHALQNDPRFLQGYAFYDKVKYWPDRCYWVYKRLDVTLPPAAQAAFPPSNW